VTKKFHGYSLSMPDISAYILMIMMSNDTTSK